MDDVSVNMSSTQFFVILQVSIMSFFVDMISSKGNKLIRAKDRLGKSSLLNPYSDCISSILGGGVTITFFFILVLKPIMSFI